MIDDILALVGRISIPNYFVTVLFAATGEVMPQDIESFVLEKHKLIQNGATGRKFVYRKGGWRMIFTFFPTNSVVDEKYALKNQGTERIL